MGAKSGRPGNQTVPIVGLPSIPLCIGSCRKSKVGNLPECSGAGVPQGLLRPFAQLNPCCVSQIDYGLLNIPIVHRHRMTQSVNDERIGTGVEPFFIALQGGIAGYSSTSQFIDQRKSNSITAFFGQVLLDL